MRFGFDRETSLAWRLTKKTSRQENRLSQQAWNTGHIGGLGTLQQRRAAPIG